MGTAVSISWCFKLILHIWKSVCLLCGIIWFILYMHATFSAFDTLWESGFYKYLSTIAVLALEYCLLPNNAWFNRQKLYNEWAYNTEKIICCSMKKAFINIYNYVGKYTQYTMCIRFVIIKINVKIKTSENDRICASKTYLLIIFCLQKVNSGPRALEREC